VATVQFAGSLGLRDGNWDDLEWRLKVRPLREGAVVRLRFRVDRKGGSYAVVLGGRPHERALALHGKGPVRPEDVVARLGERVDWKAGQWYDLRVLAVGSELRVELDEKLLCLVRDDRRHGGTLSIDVLQGGASVRDVALRALD
jgi:hypothetical protein